MHTLPFVIWSLIGIALASIIWNIFSDGDRSLHGSSFARHCLYALSIGFAISGQFVGENNAWIMFAASGVILLTGWFIRPIAKLAYKSEVYTGFALGTFLAVNGLYLIGATDQKFLGWTAIVVGSGVAVGGWTLWQFVTDRFAAPSPAPTKS